MRVSKTPTDYPKLQIRLTPVAMKRLAQTCQQKTDAEGARCPPSRIFVEYIMNGGDPLPPHPDEEAAKAPAAKLATVARRRAG